MYKLIALGFCIFMGMTAVSLGFGAIYPPLNSVAKPLVCPNGEMTYNRSFSNPLPGKTYIQAIWLCEDPQGSIQPISNFLIALYAGIFYGFLIYIFFWMIIKLRRK
ncbi:hypothetical protein [Leptospira sp. GIMC2001]|uniref:hypothetical protein n=1 Tax=Leptospira sp. GIMC2001 TaxID=1513297 RepID=UPI00234AFEE8|nr:hypothetical protein [Leptospira sp. GIMC2001]WCL47600.1 hypothetical protein O4O04_01135 [Leptospira sp. GIMC2001]